MIKKIGNFVNLYVKCTNCMEIKCSILKCGYLLEDLFDSSHKRCCLNQIEFFKFLICSSDILVWIGALLKCIKCNSNFTQMIMIAIKVHSTIRWWLTCPTRASKMARNRRDTPRINHDFYDEYIAPNGASARTSINVWGLSTTIGSWSCLCRKWHIWWSESYFLMVNLFIV